MLTIGYPQSVGDGLRHIFMNTDDIVVVGQAANGEEALRELESLSPDVVLTNIKMYMPGIDGIELTRQITQKYPSYKVIMLTLYDEYLTQALEAGAKGYLLMDIKSNELAQAIRQVYGGQTVIGQGVKSKPQS